MNIAQTIKNQIDNYYKDCSINYADLANHLAKNQIDSFESTHQHTGYDKPHNDSYPIVLYYEDDSMLVVTAMSILTARKE